MRSSIRTIEKMRLRRWAFPIIIFYSLISTCAAIPDDNMDAKNITLGRQDNGKEIRVRCGYLIQIKLEQMGGAGYQWHVDSLDREHLELLSDETKATSKGSIGAPVQRIWRFKAKKEGSAEIRIDQYRVWEGKGKAIEHFSIKLVVE